MSEQPFKEEIFDILRILASKDDLTQRDLSTHMGISLGKTNYLLKALIKRGFISVKNFYIRDSKLKKVKYILTKKGVDRRLHLTYHFLERKEAEYNRIKKEWESLKTPDKERIQK
ncbi:MAG: MarR family EPS-associated transcriptional regulator [Candidatus Omnitrophica bacterium]|nr:MarR family EPS-associated transcriptional regulator [Candidatus Omnitrophota bacterium]